MKVCIYLENYIAGGVDSVIANKVNNWPDKEDRIILACNRSHDGLKEILQKRITQNYGLVYLPVVTLPDIYGKYLPQAKIPRCLFKALWIYPRYFLLILNVFRLCRFFRRITPDALFIHNGGYPGADSARAAAISAKLCGIKSVYMVIHNLAKKSDFLRKAFEDLIDMAIDKSAEIICVSDNSRWTVSRNRKIKQPIRVIYNGAQDTFPCSNTQDLRRNYGIPPGARITGMVGSYDRRKGHEDLISAAQMVKMKKAQANIVYMIFGKGDASDKERISSEISRLGLEKEVILCGFSADIYRYYKIFDIFIQPSRESESLPMTILEAMAQGLPVIATKVGGTSEIVIDGVTGFVIPPGSPQKISEKILEIFSNEELFIKMGRMSRKRFEDNFTARQMAENYYKLICR